MKTEILLPEADNQGKVIHKAAEVIKRGGLVVLPTETVYGIAVNLKNQKAVDRLYEVKGRDRNKPLSIHIHDIGAIDRHAKDVLPYAWRVMYRSWPGPLTAILHSKSGASIGLRVPKHDVTLKVLEQIKDPIGMPSANKSGSPAAKNAQEALVDLDSKVDLIIDCGQADIGQESTVVDLREGEPKLSREGAITFESVQKEALKKKVLFVCTGNSCRSVMAHYYFMKKTRDKEYIDSDSAGVGAALGMPPSRETVEVLRQDEVDARDHHSKPIDAKLLRESDLVLVMSREHERRISSLYPEIKNKVYLLREFAKINENELDIADPIAHSFEFYKKIYNQIKECVIKITEIM